MPETIADASERLLQLDAVDRELDALAAEAAATPAELAAERGVLTELAAERDATGQRLDAAQAALATAEREHEQLEAKKARAEKRMENIASQAQLDATTRELETLAELLGDAETTILEGFEEVEATEALKAEQTARLDSATAAHEANAAAWAAREPVLTARQAELNEERPPLFDGLDSRVRQRYLLGRQQGAFKPLSGITWIYAGTVCRTCNARISPRWVQESGDYKAWHACDSCKRILVKMPALPEDEDENDEGDAEASP